MGENQIEILWWACQMTGNLFCSYSVEQSNKKRLSDGWQWCLWAPFERNPELPLKGTLSYWYSSAYQNNVAQTDWWGFVAALTGCYCKQFGVLPSDLWWWRSYFRFYWLGGTGYVASEFPVYVLLYRVVFMCGFFSWWNCLKLEIPSKDLFRIMPEVKTFLLYSQP